MLTTFSRHAIAFGAGGLLQSCARMLQAPAWAAEYQGALTKGQNASLFLTGCISRLVEHAVRL